MTQPIAQPLSILDLVEQPGATCVPRILAIPQPAVGTDFSVLVPGGVVWDLQSITLHYALSAAAPNRQVALTCSDGTNIFVRVGAVANIVANDTGNLSWLRDYGTAVTLSSTGALVAPLPPIPLPPATTISSVTSGLAAGDQFSAIVFYVIERRPPP